LQLRGYQTKLVDDVRQQIALGKTSILIQLSCGGGKTAIASDILKKTIAKGNRAIMMAHRYELCKQASETLDKFNVLHGMIQSGIKMDLTLPMQIAGVGTLRNRLEKIPIPKILVVDEASHAVSKTWKEIIDYYRQRGTIVIGLSATPNRLSNEPLSDCFETMCQGPPIKDLMDMGYLCRYRYFSPPTAIDFETISIKYGEYDKTDLEIAVNKNVVTGDAIDHYKRLMSGKRAIAFCVSIIHADAVAKQFRERGIPAESVSGNTPKIERAAVLERLKSGETLVVTNCDLYGEGVDVSAVEGVIMLRPTMSLSLYIQQSGRALRPDKENPRKISIILDHVNNVQKHGLPDFPHQWSLDGHQRRKNAPGGVGVRYCPMCYGVMYPAPICPYCGHAFTVTQRMLAQEAGQLAEFDAEQAARAAKVARMEVGQCRTMEDLKRIETERGYQKGWAWRMAKIKKIGR